MRKSDVVALQWVNRLTDGVEQRRSSRVAALEASYSVAQYYRRFRRQVGEAPSRLRRRLLLERAAYELTRSEVPIFDIGVKAGFESAETFSRGFRKAFGVSPSAYRRLAATEYRIPSPSTIHYAPGETSDDSQQGEFTMNVLDRLIDANYEGMKLILNRCESLTDQELDRPVAGYYDPLPWMSQTQTLRNLLQHTTGVSDAPVSELTIPAFKASLERSYLELKGNIEAYERDKMWDMTFVDADCDPPMVFSYGGWIGHCVTFHSYRRIACMMALSQLGHDPGGFFDPIDVQSSPQ